MGYMKRCEAVSFELIRARFSANNLAHPLPQGPDDVRAYTSYLTNKIFTYFIFFSVGYVIAITTFIAEVIYFKYEQNQLTKKRAH